jgi:hypothetical protein
MNPKVRPLDQGFTNYVQAAREDPQQWYEMLHSNQGPFVQIPQAPPCGLHIDSHGVLEGEYFTVEALSVSLQKPLFSDLYDILMGSFTYPGVPFFHDYNQDAIASRQLTLAATGLATKARQRHKTFMKYADFLEEVGYQLLRGQAMEREFRDPYIFVGKLDITPEPPIKALNQRQEILTQMRSLRSSLDELEVVLEPFN